MNAREAGLKTPAMGTRVVARDGTRLARFTPALTGARTIAEGRCSGHNVRMAQDTDAAPPYAILAALPEELDALSEYVHAKRRLQGLEVWDLNLGPAQAVACVGGVGKVNAAHAASVLLSQAGARGLFVVGVCGGLRRALTPATLVHCERAVQTDSALRSEREVASDPGLLGAWRTVAPGPQGWFLTADRPVLSLWRRVRLARAFLGTCVADMETAAAAAVARRAGVPWAALRAVTDGATEGAMVSFRKNFAVQSGRAASSVPALVVALENSRHRLLRPEGGALAHPEGSQ